MSRTALEKITVVVFCALMAHPQGIVAAANETAKRSAIGSIETHGSVRVGGVMAPTAATLFDGDTIQTSSGGATVQYREGARVVLASESVAEFSPERVQLEKGLMSFQTISSGGIVFAASSLRLEPATAKTSGNITFNDNKASVAVTEGTLKVVDPTGVQLASLNAGEARLFEEAAPTPSDPPASQDASASSPQGSSQQAKTKNSSRKWWLIGGGGAIAAAAVGIGLGLDSSSSSSSQTAALMQQVQAAQAQGAALQTQAKNSQNPTAAAIAADIAAQLAALQALLQQLNSGNTNGVSGALANITSQLNADGQSLNGGTGISGTHP